MRNILLACGCLLALAPTTARAEENVGEGADDAFGRRIGIESIGLYNERQVRGFSLENAGNYRIEGHYFAQAGASPHYLLRGATVTRIGLNATRYDFPAPSGVAEFNLTQIPPGTRLSVEAGIRAYSGPFTDIAGSIGTTDGKFGILAGANFGPADEGPHGGRGAHAGGGIIARWAPSDHFNLTAFGTTGGGFIDPGYGVRPTGEFLPPKIRRGIYPGQRWTRFDNRQPTAGLFATADLGSGWKLSGGAFHSASQQNRSDFHVFNVQTNGDYRSFAIVVPGRSASAQTGSALLEHSWGGDKVRHRIVATARYRETDNKNSPSFVFATGTGNIQEDAPQIDEPDFTASATQTLDRTVQKTAGAGYRVTIGGAVELRADLQKTHYSRTRVDASGTRSDSDSDPWLYSGSALWAAGDRITLFASYSRGLEESGVAPSTAVNRNEVLPAVIATQRELGVRYAPSKSVSLIAALFDTRKDTPATGPDGRFGLIGEVRHRGIEASLTGALTPRLNIVAGLMLLDATVSGELVEQGLIGVKAVGRPSRVGLLNLTWRPKWVEGLSLDGTVNHEGPRYISSANEVRSTPLTTIDLGFRYAFHVGKQPLSLRGRILNLTDAFAWQPDASGTLFPNSQRGYQLSLRADF